MAGGTRPPSIIFVTQLIDPDDPVLGFTAGLIRSLSQRTEVAVIAGEVRAVPADLGAEVHSMGRESGASRWRRGLSYEAGLVALCRRLHPAALYAHMCPDYVTLAAPVTKATGTPSILWFTHSVDSANLRRAERLADLVVTALPSSYPRSSPKVRAIGHSIDTRRFTYHEPPAVGHLDLLAVGRLSAVKNYPVTIRGVAIARQRGIDVRLRIIGSAVSPVERAVRADLDALVVDQGVGDAVSFLDGVTPDEVAQWLASSGGLVNASRPGQADKVVLEAMACGRPALVSSPAFGALVADLPVELGFPDDDDAGLAGAIERLATASPAAVRETGVALRARVEAGHSLEHWAGEVVSLAGALHARRNRRRLRGAVTARRSPRTGSASTAARR